MPNLPGVAFSTKCLTIDTGNLSLQSDEFGRVFRIQGTVEVIQEIQIAHANGTVP